MNGKRRLRPVNVRPPGPEAARDLAALCLGRLAAEPERLERFLALTGLTTATVRDASGEPGFAAAVLDHVLADEALLLAVADEIDAPPELLAAAQAALAPGSDEFG